MAWILPFGCRSYSQYLRTPLWKQIRKRVLARDAHKCQACLNRADCVHHIDYKKRTLAGEQDSSLISLCNECHHAVEWHGDEKIDSSSKHRKWQLLNALMLEKRGCGLSHWQGRRPVRRKMKRSRPAPKRKAPRVDRRALAAKLRKQHAAIGAAAKESLEMWRKMSHWERVNYLAAN